MCFAKHRVYTTRIVIHNTQWFVFPCHYFTISVLTRFQSSQSPTNSAVALSILTSLGGVAGYARTGSVPSIAAGLSVGALYAFSYLRLSGNQPYGEELGLLASAVLGGSAIPRALKTRKPVPIGLSMLATYGLYVFGMAYRAKRPA